MPGFAVHFDSDNTIMQSTISQKPLFGSLSQAVEAQRTSWWPSESGGNQGHRVGENRLTQILDLCSLCSLLYDLLKMLIILPASQAY